MRTGDPGSAAARLLGLRVRIPPETWMSVSSECCVLSGKGLLRRADPSSSGVILPVRACVCVSLGVTVTVYTHYESN